MNILIGVCGSISAYRMLDVVRGLTKDGHSVRVICTRGAENFVVPQSFRYLGAEAVYTSEDDFNYPKLASDSPVLHVELANWADKLVLAPLSANTMARLCRGEASDLLTSVFLAIEQKKPILVFPAMNSKMLNHPFTQENLNGLKKLKTLPQLIIHPTTSGELACGETGEGKLASVEQIIDWVETYTYVSERKKNVLITTGATISPLDPVRYLTNASSGLTGWHLARQALSEGHRVVVIAGKNATEKLNNLVDLPGFTLVRVTTTTDMKVAVDNYFKDCDYYISSAAINDIEFETAIGKIKKDMLKSSLPIQNATDILASVISSKRENQKVVGFAAETDINETTLNKKWDKKPVDLLVGTKVHNGLNKENAVSGFQNNEADYLIMDKNKKIVGGNLAKNELAKKVFEVLAHD